jgi:hypothetical protein
LTPRGAAVGPAAELGLECAGGSLGACPQGAKLVFAAHAGAVGGYLGAWAEPAGGGERVWYFSAEGESPRLEADGGRTQTLARGVRVGPEHAPGAYVVHVVLSEVPLSRAALTSAAAPGVRARASFPLGIVAP